MEGVLVTEHGLVHGTPLGTVVRVQIERCDKRPMSFTEVWEAFDEAYPGRYAVQLFPPRAHLFDQANKYHLHVLDHEPAGLDIFSYPRTARNP